MLRFRRKTLRLCSAAKSKSQSVSSQNPVKSPDAKSQSAKNQSLSAHLRQSASLSVKKDPSAKNQAAATSAWRTRRNAKARPGKWSKVLDYKGGRLFDCGFSKACERLVGFFLNIYVSVPPAMMRSAPINERPDGIC